MKSLPFGKWDVLQEIPIRAQQRKVYKVVHSVTKQSGVLKIMPYAQQQGKTAAAK